MNVENPIFFFRGQEGKTGVMFKNDLEKSFFLFSPSLSLFFFLAMYA